MSDLCSTTLNATSKKRRTLEENDPVPSVLSLRGDAQEESGSESSHENEDSGGNFRNGNQNERPGDGNYAMAMMRAMEDGATGEEYESDNEEEGGTEDAAETANHHNPAMLEVVRALMRDPIADPAPAENEREIFHNAREHAEGDDAPDARMGFDYAMGMMAAMADDSDDDSEIVDENNVEEQLQNFSIRQQESTTAPSSLLAGLGNSILQVGVTVTQAVREYYRMSQTDQLRVWDDLTGAEGQRRVFANGKELAGLKEEFEPTQMVEDALRKLPLELQRIPNSMRHEALNMVLESAPDYVHDRSFMIRFLRAEKFDVYAAASRLCRHFEAKLELFGPDKLGRDITLDDLNEDDMAAFETGYIQVLNEQDHAHRHVVFFYKAVSSECYKDRENIVSFLLVSYIALRLWLHYAHPFPLLQLRAFFYMAWRLSEREDVQKLGITNVVYNNGGFPRQGMDYEKSRRIAHLFQSNPLKMNNFYVCVDDKPWLTVVETFAVMITRFLRVRLRMFRGTHHEVLDQLRAVGVPTGALPVNAQSELLVTTHLNWIRQQKKAEEELKQKNQERTSAMEGSKKNDLYEANMNSIAHLLDITADFYGGGPADPSYSFQAVG